MQKRTASDLRNMHCFHFRRGNKQLLIKITHLGTTLTPEHKSSISADVSVSNWRSEFNSETFSDKLAQRVSGANLWTGNARSALQIVVRCSAQFISVKLREDFGFIRRFFKDNSSTF
ncbi:Protein of unknown function [Pyronema omphalodes CBS 100304]|uniref:Uncharacterized protein n=1 Tax=Pyronema omphalodes (strain CBS 100304) TaxID=1076935 RepID=U4LJ73_PYROM|nr:Protein of unknown function [Pyronema omphalodes CBS 100304]